MTIDELIQRLEEYRDTLGGDTEVRLMTQQHWPFEKGIVGLASGEEINEAVDDQGPSDDGDVDMDHVVYVVEARAAESVIAYGGGPPPDGNASG